MATKTRDAPPRAGAMLESLRGLGYSTAAALADVIDNSISAGARSIAISLDWSSEGSRISVLDDGRGMTDPELESAMRLGDKNPLDARHSSDLGRFGMGLKTASFSQCRRLTVASLKGGAFSCLRWDLDALATSADGWLLYEGPAEGSEPFLNPLKSQESGTLVLWEKLDRIVTPGYKANDFNDLIDDIEAHLAMIFHRLIEGPEPQFLLTVNGKAIKPWDPFMDDHPGKTWSTPAAKLRTPSGLIEAEGHVLPHKDMLAAKEFESGGGPNGWTAQQGFYIYRNKRLLVAGGWMGLGQGRAWNREESHRLARIRLDIPNTADAEWKIDIRKSTAKPPVEVRGWLTKIADDTRARARKVFAFRGAPVSAGGRAPVEQVWRAEHTASGIRYKIDDKNPVIAAAIEASGDSAPLINAMLRVIEETVPVQRIWLDTAEHKETPHTGFSGAAPEAVVEVLGVLYADMIGRKGLSPESAKEALLATEPFQNYPSEIASL